MVELSQGCGTVLGAEESGRSGRKGGLGMGEKELLESPVAAQAKLAWLTHAGFRDALHPF